MSPQASIDDSVNHLGQRPSKAMGISLPSGSPFPITTRRIHSNRRSRSIKKNPAFFSSKPRERILVDSRKTTPRIPQLAKHTAEYVHPLSKRQQVKKGNAENKCAEIICLREFSIKSEVFAGCLGERIICRTSSQREWEGGDTKIRKGAQEDDYSQWLPCVQSQKEWLVVLEESGR